MADLQKLVGASHCECALYKRYVAAPEVETITATRNDSSVSELVRREDMYCPCVKVTPRDPNPLLPVPSFLLSELGPLLHAIMPLRRTPK